METDMIIVLIILTLTIGLIVSDKIRLDLLALLSAMSLGWSGVLTPGEVFSGFSSNAVIIMIALMIIASGFYKSGLSSMYTRLILSQSKESSSRLRLLFSVSAGFLAGIVQNIGSAILTFPSIRQAAMARGFDPSRLIMPIGFAIIVGGTLTTVGTTPIVIAGDLLRVQGLEKFHFFESTPVGLLLLVMIIAIYALLGRHLLPDTADKAADHSVTLPESQLYGANENQPKPYAAIWVGGCIVLSIVMIVAGVSVTIAFFSAAIAMVLLRVLSLDDIYEAIEWRVVFIIAGLIPMGIAMQKSGAADYLAHYLFESISDLHLFIVFVIICTIATLFSLVMTNIGMIVVLGPMVISLADLLNVDTSSLLLMTAICAANSFILPTHQVNAFIMISGGYSSKDFLRAGLLPTIGFILVVSTYFYWI